MRTSPFKAMIKILIWKNVITKDEGDLLLKKGFSTGARVTDFEILVDKLIEGENL